MADLNSVVLVGRLTRDAAISYTSSGTAIVKFSLALNRRKKVGEGWQDEANFFDVSMMGKGAEGTHKFLVKGKMIGISGELRQNRWEKDGQSHSKVEIVAQNIQFLGDKGSSVQESKPGGQDEFTDDIPF